tara:strand:+ start:317 stop:856 length:540 start_codon:yes stop_codon:yes gene_type:complete
MGDSDNRNAQILGGSAPFWICAIIVIANTDKETADAIGLEYMYEYILALLIVSSVIIGSICGCGLAGACISVKSGDDNCMNKILVIISAIAIIGLVTIIVFLGFTYHHDASYTIIFHKTFWISFKGDYSGDISKVWAYKMMEVLVKLSGGTFMIIFVVLAFVGVCMGGICMTDKCCGDD